MTKQSLVESVPAELSIGAEDARRLAELGRQLASRSEWWGQEERPADRTVIRCRQVDADRWEVTVVDCIGLLAVRDRLIEVRPKIPLRHLLFLLGESGELPRLDETPVRAKGGEDLWYLMAAWFTRSAEQLLRRDVARDYSDDEADLAIVRGRVVPLRTARSYYRGSLRLYCHYEDFTSDTALNRVIKAAALRVLASDLLPLILRRCARGITARMDEVGPLRFNDLRARLDRRTSYYADPIALARQILGGIYRTSQLGGEAAWGFLIRTPTMVERGVRKVLERAIGDRWVIGKRGLQLAGSTMTINPDLVIGERLAVADVKYKLASAEWQRPDLYQLVTFAEGFGTSSGAIMGFRLKTGAVPSSVAVGEKALTYIAWRADPDVDPQDAANRFSSEVAGWLAGVQQRNERGAAPSPDRSATNTHRVPR